MADGLGGNRLLSNRTIAVVAVVLIVVVAAACWVLLSLYGQGTDADKARLESVRTVGTIVLGAGGFIALLLAARRQQTAERDVATKRHDLLLREQANEDARHDAAERRITDLYLKAVEQLGAEKAPVRLAGLYALERLAQDNPAHRQTIVNVVSAYLRMPYEPLPDAAEGDDRRACLEEREVRMTAQQILTDHLSPAGADRDRFWADLDVDLGGAVLIDLKLHDCSLRNANFTRARFIGQTSLLGVRFRGSTRFVDAVFEGEAWFAEAEFSDSTRFDGVKFLADARFDEASFVGATVFRRARFDGDARFEKTEFAGKVIFSEAVFAGGADFARAGFADEAYLPGVDFGRDARFVEVTFARDGWFIDVRFNGNTDFRGVVFSEDVRFAGCTLDGTPYTPPEWKPQPEYDGFG
ncbi:pentapeptide repeat-containing protein [Amycolatopsis australiensis]|uniref:Pentapeptide repeat-containing protein n=1 Tax=Amycolatopsis australiensis TaxID=546364 RepID=A0A1K1RCB8_9PSEU|nr:pentapeptide repeat-containing protein [Amycolatopsis australiensis]SFW69459.1 Pentapeptide repeat-containing protein [Amycolatopsis australiensis]